MAGSSGANESEPDMPKSILDAIAKFRLAILSMIVLVLSFIFTCSLVAVGLVVWLLAKLIYGTRLGNEKARVQLRDDQHADCRQHPGSGKPSHIKTEIAPSLALNSSTVRRRAGVVD
jgi:hypothetical protein